MTDDVWSGGGAEPPPDRTRTFVVAGVAVSLTFLIAAIVVFVLSRSGGDDAETATTTSSTAAVTTAAATTTTPPTTTSSTTSTTTSTTSTTSTTTTSTTSTSTTTTLPYDPAQFQIAIWPWFEGDLRYGAPVDAAIGFAVDYLQMVEPLIGEFQAGDSESGEVEVRSFEGAEPITVAVRRLADSTWWVLSAQSPNIVVTQPAAGTALGNPLPLRGRSVSFDGTIDVQIRADGNVSPILESFVTGGVSPGEPDDFSGTFEWTPPASGDGAILFIARSPDDGRVIDATVQRQTFGD